MTEPDAPARQQLLDVLQPLLPAHWQVVADERQRDDVDATSVLLSQRTIERHPQAGTGVHLVGFTVTVTVPGTQLDTAEDRLDDDLDQFLWTLDEAGIVWEQATKAIYGDKAPRLGYQLGLQVSTFRLLPDADLQHESSELDTTETEQD